MISESLPKAGSFSSRKRLRHLRIGDAGEVRARLQRVAREGAPARSDFEDARAGADPAFLEAPVEFPGERVGERLVVMRIDALAVGRQHRVEEAQKELRVGIVVRADRLAVRIDLPEDRRLHEAPCGDQRMPVVQRSPQRERRDHVAVEVHVAPQVGLGDVSLVEALQRLHGAMVLEFDAEAGRSAADLAAHAVGQRDREGRLDRADAADETVEPRARRGRGHASSSGNASAENRAAALSAPAAPCRGATAASGASSVVR